jgi:hypothetical protein
MSATVTEVDILGWFAYCGYTVVDMQTAIITRRTESVKKSDNMEENITARV